MVIDSSSAIVLINEETIRDRIYIVRGQKVMLDFELASIYGYETKNFNRQVKNNSAKFDGEDFMFRLTADELVAFAQSAGFNVVREERRSLDISPPNSLLAKYPRDWLTNNEIFLLLRKG